MRKRQVQSYREKEREDKGGGGLGKLVLLLLWPPSSLLTGPLEVFQRALLYLIKASQAPGSAPRPAIFLHFLQTPARILKKEVVDKGSRYTDLKEGTSIYSGYWIQSKYTICKI